jgi:hypothetical protein
MFAGPQLAVLHSVRIGSNCAAEGLPEVAAPQATVMLETPEDASERVVLGRHGRFGWCVPHALVTVSAGDCEQRR